MMEKHFTLYAKDGAKERGSEKIQTTKYRPYMIISEVGIPMLADGNKAWPPNNTLQIHV